MTASLLVAFTLTWFADIAVLTSSNDPFGSPTTWLAPLVTGPLIALAVPDTPWSPPLGRRVPFVLVVSVTLTVWSVLQPPALHWWGALETAGLLGLTIRITGHPGRASTAAAWTVAISVAVLLLPLRSGGKQTFIAGSYVLIIALAVGITIGCAIRTLEARRQRTAHDVRQAERLALARDLHDLIAHHMSGIIVQANAALAIRTTAPDQVEPILRNIAHSGTQTLESMRRLVRVLREENHTALRPGDLLTELADLVSAHCAATGQDTGTAMLEASAAARTAHLSPEVEISAHRAVQEALTNVRRHAPGARTTVRLDADADRLRITVANTAPPGGTAQTAGRGGYGLLGLRERMEALDGTLEAGPLPGGGWQLTAVLPLTTPPA
ncbi:histidine kinase [Streptomyces sp. CS131]|uniref:sensor histidine kinase n=1 Tax=Streptomyces sp. CS131 TaxID=2162711 RepID=UPI0013A57D25|nr:histidine kinase [Streptomyces sp. CS131]